MRKITMTDRLRYEFDKLMERGTVSLIAGLGVVSAVFVLGMSAIVFLSGMSIADERPDGFDFFQIAWMSLLRTFDPGTMGADTGNAPFLATMLLVTLGGIFLVSTLIGIVTSGIEAKARELGKGRSFVVERNHTLVLGWSPQIFSIISELLQANANQRRSCIVILADKDKQEMQDEIRSRIGSRHKTRIICRTGNPLDVTDLGIANPQDARAIIIISPETDDPDIHVIKVLLALTNGPQRKQGRYHIVAGIRDPKNVEVARMIGRTEVQIIPIGDLISRVTAQACRQSGLSVVYNELLNFDGDEIYFKEERGLVGKTFGEALFAYDDSTVIGLQRRNGQTWLNPPMDTLIESGEEIIAISGDDDKMTLSGMTEFDIAAPAIKSRRKTIASPENTLILGWNSRGTFVIAELDNYVALGSHTTVVADSLNAQSLVPAIPVRNQLLTFRLGDTTDRQTLDLLDIPNYDHVIVLSCSDDLNPQEADARTLITLLQLRELGEKSRHDIQVVSEMLDVRNRELAEVTRADDFIVSDQLVSLLLAQISENRHLTDVFTELFDPQGCEIYLNPAEDYVSLGTPVNFYTVLEAARCRDEVALGYRLHRNAHNPAQSYGVVLNPGKSKKASFAEGDKIVVLAKD